MNSRDKAARHDGMDEVDELDGWIAEAAMERWEHFDRAERKRERKRDPV